MELNHILDQIEITPELLERTNPVFRQQNLHFFSWPLPEIPMQKRLYKKWG